MTRPMTREELVVRAGRWSRVPAGTARQSRVDGAPLFPTSGALALVSPLVVAHVRIGLLR
jgi:hypothetical protein